MTSSRQQPEEKEAKQEAQKPPDIKSMFDKAKIATGLCAANQETKIPFELYRDGDYSVSKDAKNIVELKDKAKDHPELTKQLDNISELLKNRGIAAMKGDEKQYNEADAKLAQGIRELKGECKASLGDSTEDESKALKEQIDTFGKKCQENQLTELERIIGNKYDEERAYFIKKKGLKEQAAGIRKIGKKGLWKNMDNPSKPDDSLMSLSALDKDKRLSPGLYRDESKAFSFDFKVTEKDGMTTLTPMVPRGRKRGELFGPRGSMDMRKEGDFKQVYGQMARELPKGQDLVLGEFGKNMPTETKIDHLEWMLQEAEKLRAEGDVRGLDMDTGIAQLQNDPLTKGEIKERLEKLKENYRAYKQTVVNERHAEDQDMKKLGQDELKKREAGLEAKQPALQVEMKDSSRGASSIIQSASSASPQDKNSIAVEMQEEKGRAAVAHVEDKDDPDIRISTGPRQG